MGKCTHFVGQSVFRLLIDSLGEEEMLIYCHENDGELIYSTLIHAKTFTSWTECLIISRKSWTLCSPKHVNLYVIV